MKKRRKKSKIGRILGKSPINYFSDLFMVFMCLAFIVVVLVMMAMAIYSTVKNADNSIWPELSSLVAVPLSAGGAIWMIKNSVQHAIASQKGTVCPSDFPKVETDDLTIEEEIVPEKGTQEGVG